ncbi:MAG: RHS repeat-associated core domain-containing protein [Armatimonadota bacterium]
MRFLSALFWFIFGVQIGLASNNDIDSTDYDKSMYRSVKVSPYNTVSTMSGSLNTTIPIASAKGHGAAQINIALTHENMRFAGYNFAPRPGDPGEGWSLSCESYVGADGNGIVQYIGGKAVNRWNTIINNGFWSVGVRKPGTRADAMITEQIIGAPSKMEISDQSSRTKYFYELKPIPYAGASRLSLVKIQDLDGNQVIYTYDAVGFLATVGLQDGRNFSFFYHQVASRTTLWTITYNRGGGDQQVWELIHTVPPVQGWQQNLLTSIKMPWLSSLNASGTPQVTRPQINMSYFPATPNITDISDPSGSKWAFSYAPHLGPNGTGIGFGQIGIFEVKAPSLGLDRTVANVPTHTFTWAQNWATNEIPPPPSPYLECTIKDARNNYWLHRYSGQPSGVNTDYQYNPFPIRMVKEPQYASPQGVNRQHYELFFWNTADATLTRYEDRNGHATDFYYSSSVDNHGLLLTKNKWTSATTYLQETYYWINDLLKRETNPRGVKTLYYYNANRHITKKIQDPITDDTEANVISKPSGINKTEQFSYYPNGELQEQWTDTFNKTTYGVYDSFGNPSSITAPNGGTTTFLYDGQGRRTSETKPSPQGTTLYAYDEYNKGTKITPPIGATTVTEYDINGNPVWVSSRLDATTTAILTRVGTKYDAWGRAVSTRRLVSGNANAPVEIIESTGYDNCNNPITVTNGLNKSTTYYFDARGVNYRVSQPNGISRYFDYFGERNLIWSKNGRQQVTTYGYDWLDRVISKYYGANLVTSFGYREDGVVLTMGDPTGTTTSTYDDIGRLKTELQPLSGKTITHTYNDATRVHTVNVGSQTYTYNMGADSQLSSISQTLGNTANPTTFYYNPDGSLDYRGYGASLKSKYVYDANGRVTSISQLKTGNIIDKAKFEYQYGVRGTVDQYKSTITNTVQNSVSTTNYVHDLQNRLTSEIRTSNASYDQYNIQYDYDANNNRKSVKRNGSAPVPYEYNPVDPDELWIGEGYSFSLYDADGNPTQVVSPSQGTLNLNYDQESRIVQITKSLAGPFILTNQIIYRYDGLGRRVEKNVGNNITRFVFDGRSIIADVVTTANNFQTYYLSGVGYVRDGVQTYFQENALGSAVLELNTTGGLISRREYDAYGQESNVQVGANTPFRFAGKHGYQTDLESGFDLLDARFYLPGVGRFLTQDSIGQKGGLNLYSYCSNSPLSSVDPDGKYEVRIGYHGIVGQRAHSYLLITDNVRGSKTYGWTWAYSYGPQNHNAASLTTYTAGKVTDYSGLYNSHQYDWKEKYGGNHGRFVLESNQDQVGGLLNFLAQMRKDMSANGYPKYDLLGFNSNSMTFLMTHGVSYYYNEKSGHRGAYNNIEGRAESFYRDGENNIRRKFTGWNAVGN